MLADDGVVGGGRGLIGPEHDGHVGAAGVVPLNGPGVSTISVGMGAAEAGGRTAGSGGAAGCNNLLRGQRHA